jgi:hypothetical protein
MQWTLVTFSAALLVGVWLTLLGSGTLGLLLNPVLALVVGRIWWERREEERRTQPLAEE